MGRSSRCNGIRNSRPPRGRRYSAGSVRCARRGRPLPPKSSGGTPSRCVPKEEEPILRQIVERENQWSDLANKFLKKQATYEGISNYCDFLVPNTQGRRSADWFIRTSKYFTTHVAKTCEVAAVAHPHVGMGAAHYDSMTGDVVKRLVKKIKHEKINMFDVTIPIDQSLTHEELQKIVIKTLHSAMDEFSLLRPSSEKTLMLSNDIMISIAGLSGMTQPMVLDKVLQSSLREHSLFRSIQPGQGIEFNRYFGSKSEIVYGGKNHPLYNTLTIRSPNV